MLQHHVFAISIVGMKKLYYLKSWYSLEDAAKRLTITLGEDVSVNDVLQMSVEGHLPLSWYMRHVPARKAAPYTKIYNWDTKFKEINEKIGIKHEFKPNVLEVALCLEYLSDEVCYLDGAHRLELEMCGVMKDWVLSLITNTGGDLMSFDGYFVIDNEGSLWQIMERFTKNEQEASAKEDKSPAQPLFSKPLNHSSYFYPSGGSPDEADLGITKSDLEAFEALLTQHATQPQNNNVVKPLSTTERETAYKLIVGMAKGGYGYDPTATRGTAITDIVSDLNLQGMAVSDDTVRRWLQDGVKHLGDTLEKA